jgi:hypothetical protein
MRRKMMTHLFLLLGMIDGWGQNGPAKKADPRTKKYQPTQWLASNIVSID